MHHDPVELVLDHAADTISVDGDFLPFPLSLTRTKVVYDDDRAVAQIELEVDSLRVVPPPAPEPVTPEPAATPEEAFEARLDRIRSGQG
ncbi:hypothetical protein L5I01_17485 [Gordonia sp. HY442]|uniref:hypothetical protein n=1 Tax=Gordonia zhenghanii TaxID=2911516 RepID=UPI001F1E8B8C|nr:hypothetical protein [Gordonia zhenghanii]MCF8605150.1 hypothetical protein [Gordonia zhenghanii]